MTVKIDLDVMLNNLVSELGSSVFFIIITSENGVVMKSYINEEEFNKSSIGLNISQIYELGEDLVSDLGLAEPDFNIIHTANYYILSIKFLEKIIILLILDQIDIADVFKIINNSVSSQ